LIAGTSPIARDVVAVARREIRRHPDKLSARDGSFRIVGSEIRVDCRIRIKRFDVLVGRMIVRNLVEASGRGILQLDDSGIHSRSHEELRRHFETEGSVGPEEERAVVEDVFLQTTDHKRIEPVRRFHVGKWNISAVVSAVAHLFEEVHRNLEPFRDGDDVALMKPAVVLAVDRTFSIEILRGFADRGIEVLVIGKEMVFFRIATRDERAVRERSARNRLDAGHGKSRSVIELLLGEFTEEITGFLGLVCQHESRVLARGSVDVLADHALWSGISVGEELGNRNFGLAVLELEVEMRPFGRTGISDFSENQPLADSVAFLDGDGIVLHVGVTRADVVAVIDDHAVAPRSTPAGFLDGAFSGCQNELAIVIFSGQVEVQAVLARRKSGMSPIAHVGIGLSFSVSLFRAILAVARPRLSDFPVILGVERNLEVGRDTATAVVHGQEVFLVRGVLDDVAVGHLLVVGTESADVDVVHFRDLASAHERENHGHDGENDVTHDKSPFLLPLPFLPPRKFSAEILSNQPNQTIPRCQRTSREQFNTEHSQE